MPREPLVTHVSDTAGWVAAYRAQETNRADALFRDPLAARLAGDQGRAIAARAPSLVAGNVILRTKLIDDLILQSISEGFDRVVNLAAGLDTRPYRLPLPADLRWIEADLPALVARKEDLLAHERPVCALVREPVNLVDPAARDAFLDRAMTGARKPLVLTEGLLMYLAERDVVSIAEALRSRPTQRWILDLFSPLALRAAMRRLGNDMASPAPRDRPPLAEDGDEKFAPGEGVAWFERRGWRVVSAQSVMRQALRTRRVPWYAWPLRFVPDADPRDLAKSYWYGVVALAPSTR